MGFLIQDGATGNTAGVTADNRLQTVSISVTQIANSSLDGSSYDFNSGLVTLTNAVETPLLYLKNQDPNKVCQIERFITSFGLSTGGANQAIIRLYSNITGGTITTGTVAPSLNRNFGTSTPALADCRIGATGLTFVGGTNLGQTFTGSAFGTTVLQTEVTIPNGASGLITYQPPAGNTSQVVAILFVVAFIALDNV